LKNTLIARKPGIQILPPVSFAFCLRLRKRLAATSHISHWTLVGALSIFLVLAPGFDGVCEACVFLAD